MFIAIIFYIHLHLCFLGEAHSSITGLDTSEMQMIKDGGSRHLEGIQTSIDMCYIYVVQTENVNITFLVQNVYLFTTMKERII